MRFGRTELLDAGLVALVLVVGLWQLPDGPVLGRLVVVALAATATAVSRRRPAVALALTWICGLVQLAVGHGVAPFELAVFVVAFATARYGSRSTVLASGLSIAVGPCVALGLGLLHPAWLRQSVSRPESELLSDVLRTTSLGVVGVGLLGVAVLAAPWVLGLLFRTTERYRGAEAEHRIEQARADAVAAAQSAQTRLTRDVHDVVGHSLAVIIAQADAARLAAANAEPPVREALDRIATVGRASLAEVRDVLSRTGDAHEADVTGPELAELIAGVRAAGHDVVESIDGSLRPLDPAKATAAYRVLRELLTNALKHGTGGATEVSQHWTADALTLRVTNAAADEPASADTDGMGLAGARTRLDAVGGTLRIAHARGRFTAVVQLPLAESAATVDEARS